MHKFRLFILVFLAIAVSCGIFYFNSLHNPYIWDDDGLIVRQPLIRSFSNFFKVFVTDLYFGSSIGSNFYRPLQALSYMWDYYLWQLDPFGYHLTNLTLQIIVSFLVFLFVRFILMDVGAAFFAALLFASSPLHTEAVTYISGRADMLMGAFVLSSFLFFARGRLFLSWIFFALALLSKELAVVFPLAIICYLYYYRRTELRAFSRFARLVLPFILIDLAYIFLRATYLNFCPLRPQALAKFSLFQRLSVFPEALFSYLKLLIFPVNLHMSRQLKPQEGFWVIFPWAALIVFGISCAYFLRKKIRPSAVYFFLCWFLIFLIPQAGIFPINAFVAEHFVYLSSISFFGLLAYFLKKHLRKSLFIIILACLTLAYGMLTVKRNIDWSDPVTFYNNIIRFSPDSFHAHNNLGTVYEQKKLYAQAIDEYKKALSLYPGLIEARSNLANVYYKLGRFSEAREEYAAVEKDAPAAKVGELQNNIGCIYEVQGQLDKALRHFQLALKYDPKLNFAHFNMAKVYIRRADQGLAAKEIFYSLPEIAAKGRDAGYISVISSYIRPFKDVSCSISFYNNLGLNFAASGYMDAAIAAFTRALDLDPGYSDARFNLALAYLKSQDKRRAILELKTVLKANPNHLQSKELLHKIK